MSSESLFETRVFNYFDRHTKLNFDIPYVSDLFNLNESVIESEIRGIYKLHGTKNFNSTCKDGRLVLSFYEIYVLA